jgi:hypothetical protein
MFMDFVVRAGVEARTKRVALLSLQLSLESSVMGTKWRYSVCTEYGML